jgi:hypothetical protein
MLLRCGQSLRQWRAAGSSIGRRSWASERAQDQGSDLSRIVAGPSQRLRARAGQAQNGQEKVEGRCLLGTNPLGDALGFAFERGQIEIRLAMQFGGDGFDLCRPNAALFEQARGGAAGSQQAKQDVKGSRCPAIGGGQSSRFD